MIGAVTKGMVKRQELQRMREMGRPGMSDEDLEIMDKVIELAEDEERQATAAATANKVSAPVSTSKPKAKFSKRQRVVMAADKVVGFVLSNTIGRVARLIGGKLLGKIPETAKSGSFHEEVKVDSAPVTISDVDSEGVELLEEAISIQLKEDAAASTSADTEDEALFANLYNENSASKVEEKSLNWTRQYFWHETKS